MANPTPPADTAAPAETKKSKTITVYATAHLNEDGVTYAPKDALEVTEARAAALGSLVTRTKPEEA